MDKATKQYARLIRVSTTRTDGGSLFGSTVKERWERFVTPDRQNRVAIGNHCMLINHPKGLVLVNAGPGDKASLSLDVAPMRSRSCLLRELRDLGIVPKDIAMVIYTHLFDEHAGGGTHMTSSGRVLPTFLNARYVVQRAAVEEASRPNERSSHFYRSDDFLPIQETDQMDIVEGSSEVLPGIWVEPAPGPTAGHQIVVAECGRETFAFLGMLAPTSMHLSGSVTSASDWDPSATKRSKEVVQRTAAAEGWYVGPVGSDNWVFARELDALAASSAGFPVPAKSAAAPRVRMPELAGV
ncbi:MAG: MBL fold metallo-hydrolase [Dehalococcoidia bacterium]